MLFWGGGGCRSAKAGYYASRYKTFGNLCYVIGALQAFMGHKNVDLRVKVSTSATLIKSFNLNHNLIFRLLL